MKKVWKGISICALVALISIGGTYGTYTYLENRNLSSSVPGEYGQVFDQKNFHLASLTEGGYPDFTKVAEHSVHAVVQIKSTVKVQERGGYIDPFEFFFGFGDRGGSAPQERVQTGLGSGVIISSDGYIITNNHVIDKASNLEVTLNNNKKYDARIIGTDPTTDVALLKINEKDLPYLTFGNSDNLKVGEWVLAIGNPMGLTSTVTAGIVSAKGRGGITQPRRGDDGSRMNIESFIQTDAAINSGNSGGALVNTDGQLVGINTAIYSRTGDFAGYGFAVPISIAGKIVADLKEFGTVQRAMLGVSMNSLATLKGFSKEEIDYMNRNSEVKIDYDKLQAIKLDDGVYILGFQDVSPAKQAGVEVGDVITAVNGVKVSSGSGLQEQISKMRPGDKVDLSVVRNGATKTISVTLKNTEGSTSVVKKADGLASVGAAFKELPADKLKEYSIGYGVEVAGVDNAGKFKKGGISKGFIIQRINNEPVSSPEQVESLIQQAASSQDKVLFISGFYPVDSIRKYYAIDLNDSKK